MRAVVLIPARYASQRFPAKMLARLEGLPLIEHVYRRASRARKVAEVIVATDDDRIRATVEGFGGRAVMTPFDCPSGTDRVALAARDLEADLLVNVQGDEPRIHPEAIDQLIGVFEDEPATQMGTLCVRLTDPEAFRSPHVVKVVVDEDGNALYFSRAPIPWDRDRPAEPSQAYKHLGIYAYRPEALRRFVGWPAGRLESLERLEQLRALENGMAIRVVVTTWDSVGVDTPEDLAALCEDERTGEGAGSRPMTVGGQA